jgi:hypothetical protein
MDELRRIAFGRGSTDEERAAATRRLEELAAAEDAATRPEAVPAPGGSSDDEVETDAGESTAVAVPGPARRRSIPLAWLLPAVIAALVVGGIAGRATTPSPVPVTAPVTTHRHLGNSAPNSTTPGNLVAANAWLDRSPTSADTFPNPSLIGLQKLSSVRHLKDIDYGGTPITLWAAKDDNSHLCLITSVPGGIFGTQCTAADDFANHGITGGFNGLVVSWDGVSTSVRLSMSGLDG